MQIESSSDLLSYLLSQANSGVKNWFGFAQQRITGIYLAHEIAKYHADKFTPDEIADYVITLNNSIYQKLIKGDGNG
ncbi:MAG: hypothetical protein WCI80_01265 [Bacteroidota bacterium]